MKHKFWHIPVGHKIKNRQISLLELFFDILIVVFIAGAIQRLINEIERNIDVGHMTYILIEGITVFFIWKNFALYSSKYEVASFRHRFFTMILMLFMSIMVLSVHLDHGNIDVKSAIYLNGIGEFGAIFILFYLNISASAKAICPYEKKILTTNAWGRLSQLVFLFFIMLFYFISSENDDFWEMLGIVVSIFSLITWMIFDYVAVTNKSYANTNNLSREYLQERHAILFIIFTGELLLQSITKISMQISNSKEITLGVGKLIAAFVVIIGFWWTFNDLCKSPNLIRRPHKIFTYTYGIIGMLTSLIILATGFSIMLDTRQKNISSGKWLIFTSIFLWQFFKSIVAFSLRPYEKKYQMIFPQTFVVLVKTSPIWFWCYGFIVFIPEITSFHFTFICLTALIVEILIIEIFRIYINVKIDKNKEKFHKYIKISEKKEEKWINNHIKKYIDVEWHKENDFSINRFSELAKKMDEEKIKSA